MLNSYVATQYKALKKESEIRKLENELWMDRLFKNDSENETLIKEIDYVKIRKMKYDNCIWISF